MKTVALALTALTLSGCGTNTSVDNETPVPRTSLQPSKPISPKKEPASSPSGDSKTAKGTDVNSPAGSTTGDARNEPVPAESGGEEPAVGETETPAVVPVTAPELPVLELTIEGFKSSSGQLCYSIFDEARANLFGRNDVSASDVALAECVPANTGSVTVNITTLPAGKYAIALFHDENGNGQLDKLGALGVPTEPFGFSQNPPLRIGAPDFGSCAFELAPAGGNETIRLLKVL